MYTRSFRFRASAGLRIGFFVLAVLAFALPGALAQNQIDKCAMLQAVNTERANNGLSPLTWNSKLEQASLTYTADMAATGAWNHIGSDGSTIASRITATTYVWSNISENIAAGQTTVTQVMTDWMNSPGHRANILDPVMTEFGAARLGNFWTQNFGRPPGGGTSSGTTDPCAPWTTHWNQASTVFNQYVSLGAVYLAYSYYYYYAFLGNYYYYSHVGQTNAATYNYYAAFALYYYYYYGSYGNWAEGGRLYNYFIGYANAAL